MGLAFRIALLALLLAATVALFLHSENGRYQFVKSANDEVVIDTRTGEYWLNAGAAHVDPRHAKVETNSGPAVTELKPKQ